MGTSLPRSIVYVITSLAYGGAETQLVAMARRLRARGWEVSVASMVEPEAFQALLEEDRIGLVSLGMRRGAPDPRGLLRLARHLRSQAPSVVHSHMVHANLLARVARALVPVPFLVSTAHNVQEGGRWRELAYRATDPLCDLTTNVSQAAVERYVRVGAVPAGKIRFVPNGVDLASFSRQEARGKAVRDELGLGDRFVFLAVGRFAPAKDYQTMLRALVDAPAEAVLMVAGDGELRPAMAELAHTLGVARRVRFLGIRDDVAALMSAADAFVLSSAWEGLPMVLLEAAATSLPIVATDVGGVAEAVRDGVTGFVVPAGRPEALARAMQQLMTMRAEDRRRMGDAGRRHVVEQFDVERVCDVWERIYLAGMEASGGARVRIARRLPAALQGEPAKIP